MSDGRVVAVSKYEIHLLPILIYKNTALKYQRWSRFLLIPEGKAADIWVEYNKVTISIVDIALLKRRMSNGPLKKLYAQHEPVTVKV